MFGIRHDLNVANPYDLSSVQWKVKGTLVGPRRETLYVYDEAGQLLGEYDGGGALLREVVWLGTQPVGVSHGGETYAIETDQLNTPRAVVDVSGRVIWRWMSDAFGTTAANDDADGDGRRFEFNLRFPGQYFDPETGLHYNYFRTYDPKTGRYTQSDPIGLRGGLNTFLYANANPLSFIDPLGLETTVVCRSVEDWKAKALGAKHCFVVVWHWDNANGGCNGSKVIDKQYSLAGNPTPFPQDSKAPTFQSDRNTWFRLWN